MTPRLNPFTASPAAMQPWIDLRKTIQDDGLEPLLKELVMMQHLADQRLRLLHPLSHIRCPQAWRDRGAALLLKRGAQGLHALFRARAGCARLDRGADASVRDPRAGRCLRGPAPALQRRGAGEAHLADRARQRLEPDQYRLSFRPPGRSEERGLMEPHRAGAIKITYSNEVSRNREVRFAMTNFVRAVPGAESPCSRKRRGA